LPDKLSDLTPEFIHDPKTLICPFVQRTGNLRSWRERVRYVGASDPRTSYGYEFCLEKIHPEVWRGVAKTQREYKQRQLERLKQPVVPIVRCLAHRPILNLAYGGRIYPNSGTDWEDSFKYLASPAELIPMRLFSDRSVRKNVTSGDFPTRSRKRLQNCST
jgi:hypothetical protein